jgi:hypothetical protein
VTCEQPPLAGVRRRPAGQRCLHPNVPKTRFERQAKARMDRFVLVNFEPRCADHSPLRRCSDERLLRVSGAWSWRSVGTVKDLEGRATQPNECVIVGRFRSPDDHPLPSPSSTNSEFVSSCLPI